MNTFKIRKNFEKPVPGGEFDVVNRAVEKAAKEDPALVWLESVVAKHTPRWVQLLAIIAQEKPFAWMRTFPLPLIRRFTDVTVKTETHIERPKGGFREGTALETRVLRVYKRGRLIASETFGPVLIKNNTYNKLV